MCSQKNTQFEECVTSEYDPLKVGSIDGTDTIPHDRGIIRALSAKHFPPHVKSRPSHTLFVGRLPRGIKERHLETVFSEFADVKDVKVIRDIVTGAEKGYAFVELKHSRDVERVVEKCQGLSIEGQKVLVDKEVGRTLKGWVPRRLGGGYGGRKESGQLRFGCIARPWKRPLKLDARKHSESSRGKFKVSNSSKHTERDSNSEKYLLQKIRKHHK